GECKRDLVGFESFDGLGGLLIRRTERRRQAQRAQRQTQPPSSHDETPDEEKSERGARRTHSSLSRPALKHRSLSFSSAGPRPIVPSKSAFRCSRDVLAKGGVRTKGFSWTQGPIHLFHLSRTHAPNSVNETLIAPQCSPEWSPNGDLEGTPCEPGHSGIWP